MNEQIIAAIQLLPNFLAQHTFLCAAALTLGISLALPLAILAARRPQIRYWVLSITGLIQTVPGLALLAMFYPLLLGVLRCREGARRHRNSGARLSPIGCGADLVFYVTDSKKRRRRFRQP